MKALLAALSLTAFIVGCSADSAESAEVGDARLYSVLFYADWCGSCKVLDPALREARDIGGLDREAVLFVRFDLTDDDTRVQSAMLANALGLGDLYAANDGRTGYALLVDAETLQPRTQFTKKMSAEAIAMTIKSGLAF